MKEITSAIVVRLIFLEGAENSQKINSAFLLSSDGLRFFTLMNLDLGLNLLHQLADSRGTILVLFVSANQGMKSIFDLVLGPPMMKEGDDL